MQSTPVFTTRMRGLWLGTTDHARNREFYERLGAHFESDDPHNGIISATLGGTTLVFELVDFRSIDSGPVPLFEVTDADAMHEVLVSAGCEISHAPRSEPWGRQFDVIAPDGQHLAFLGPLP